MKTRVHVIYCHPSTKSVTCLIKEGYLKGLEDNGVEYTLTDLYESNFNSDLSEDEYLRENNNIPYKLSEDVVKEQELINNSDILTFIFPLFWMDAPAKLVGYFSRVFTKGFRYNDDETEEGMKTLDETNFLISAGSSYADLKKDNKVSALKTIFVDDRMNNKTEKSSMYFFSQTTFKKEKILKNRKKYFNMAKKIGGKV